MKIGAWYLINHLVLKNPLVPFSGFKLALLRFFDAKIGMGVVIKPQVNIKCPWFLEIGDFVWIGEGVWIDNLTRVSIGSNSCISQGALLLTGNHDYKKSGFDLITGEILLDEGVWIAAKSVVCPGIHCKSHSVLEVGSIATKDLEPYTIYQGNPAIAVRMRLISD